MTEPDGERIAKLEGRLEEVSRRQDAAEARADHGLRDLWDAHDKLRACIVAGNKELRHEIDLFSREVRDSMTGVRAAVREASWAAIKWAFSIGGALTFVLLGIIGYLINKSWG